MQTKQPLARLAVFIHLAILIGLGSPALAQTIDFNAGPITFVGTTSQDALGQIWIGGRFSSLAGQSRTNLGRFNSEGTLDFSFKPDPTAPAGPGTNPSVGRVIHQQDGKTVATGFFQTISGLNRRDMVRFYPDGSQDLAFAPNFLSSSSGSTLNTAAIQPDGKIIAAGSFTSLNGQGRNYIARLNSDGSLDESFQSPFSTGVSKNVSTVALQPNGKIVVGGTFIEASFSRTNLLRLNPDGVVDTAFQPAFNGSVSCIAIQADDRLVIAGTFTNIAGVARTNLARLNSDGSFDHTFNASPNNSVIGVVIQTDGKLIVTGSFTQMNGQAATRIARLNPDGTLDPTFNFSLGTSTAALSLQDDGRILVSDLRLTNTDAANESTTFSDTTVQWVRSGTGPELLSATLSTSQDGISWTNVSVGQRIPGGWTFTGTNFNSASYIRFTGLVQQPRSSWFLERTFGALMFTEHPSSRTNNAQTIATLSGIATGTGPITYQWHRAGVPLENGGKISGVTTPFLVLTNVLGSDAGEYFLVASNSSGSVTSTVAQLTVVDPVIVTQPVNQATNPGGSVAFTVVASGTEPLSYQWRKDGSDLAEATSSSLPLSNVQGSDIADYDVIVSNSFGSVTSSVAKFHFQAAPDSLNPNVASAVHAIVVQPDGRIVIGGEFLKVSEQNRYHIARLNPDGSLDPGFNPSASQHVFTMALQPDGKILAGGFLKGLGGLFLWSDHHVARMNPDGTPDPTFTPSITGDGGQFRTAVYSIVVRPNGNILIGGDFRSVNGIARTNIAELFPDGTLNTNFNASANDIIYPMILQADGKIVIGGAFTNVSGHARQRLARLNPDGTVDLTFNPGANALPLCLAAQPDGKLVVGGVFSVIAGHSRNDIARLHPDGSLDTNFNAHANAAVRTIALQSDGKILLGGSFGQLNGVSRPGLGRLEKDGSLDPTFANSGCCSAVVYSLAQQPDGRVLVGGSFNAIFGQNRNSFARLYNTEPTSQSLLVESDKITWVRSGPGPEPWKVNFSIATNDAGWVHLGNGERVASGWQISGLQIQPDTTVRARAHIAAGRYGSSTWFTDATGGALRITQQPTDQTNRYGTTASFQVEVGGTPPIDFQWYKNGLKLTNNSLLTGTQSPLLLVSNVNANSLGEYSVVVSDSSISLTSQVARLTVLDPFPISNPTNVTTNAGASASFSFRVGGSSSVGYQWYKDGEKLPLAKGSANVNSHISMTLHNLTYTNNGNYWAVFSNFSGVVTSGVATLTVIDPFIISHPQSRVAQPGETVTFSSTVAGAQPIHFQWSKDGIAIPGATTNVLTLTNVQWTDRGDFSLTVSNANSTFTSQPARLSINLAVADELKLSGASHVQSVAIQPDGHLLVGTGFSLIRLNSAGEVDTNFTVTVNSTIMAIGLQQDGKIIVGGAFTNLNGFQRNYVGRLHADGSVDQAFDPSAGHFIRAIAIQPDGKIILGGSFNFIANTNRRRLVRLENDGTLDLAFNPEPSSEVEAVTLQSDGSILVGGHFSSIGGFQRSRIARLHSDGTQDTNYNSSANSGVYALAVSHDDQVFAAGNFTNLSGESRSYLGRLLSDGSADPSFAPDIKGIVETLAVQTDGKLIIGGDFTNVNSATHRLLARLHNDGTLDETFNPVVTTAQPTLGIRTLALQTNGQLVVGGNFTALAGQARTNFARLNATEGATDSLMASPGKIYWSRDGSGPSVVAVTFEASSDGLTWSPLGSGTRIAHDWEWVGTIPSEATTIRARGQVSGSGHSFWFVESIIHIEPANPVILLNDGHFGFSSNGFGFNISGRIGDLIVLEGSSDLSNWITIATNSIEFNPTYFSDSEATNYPMLFYRTRVQGSTRAE